MTCKQFIHSTTFKCILVLLCIALVAGGLLAILNDLWAVSDEEIISRAINEICGKDVSLKGTVQITKDASTNDYGTVQSAYLLSTGDYLITAKGGEGYHSGSVSCYVLANFEDGAFVSIETVSIADYDSSQTLMSKFTAQALKFFKGTKATNETSGFITTGASYSSKAVKNAVNSALDFINNDLSSMQIKYVEG